MENTVAGISDQMLTHLGAYLKMSECIIYAARHVEAGVFILKLAR